MTELTRSGFLSRLTRRALMRCFVVCALGALAVMGILAAPASAAAGDAGRTIKGDRSGALEFDILHRRPVAPGAKELAERLRGVDEEDGNDHAAPTPSGVVPPPVRPAASDPEVESAVFGPLPVRSVARAAAATDFEFWRRQPTGSGTAAVGEPSWANDRNAILYTCNWGAAVSPDNGMTWSFVDPEHGSTPIDAGFCCDQNVLAVDRGAYSLILWVQQTSSDSDGNHIRLVIYQGRDELLSQSNYCIKDWATKDFGLGVGQFDFSYIASTDKFVYLSSNAKTLSGAFKNGVVWRLPISKLDSDDCHKVTGGHYWTGASTDWGTALAQGPGSTMYWAFHSSNNGKLDVWGVPDSSHTATENVARGRSTC
jgi:hypothetical protein